jgi:hypothetical protein
MRLHLAVQFKRPLRSTSGASAEAAIPAGSNPASTCEATEFYGRHENRRSQYKPACAFGLATHHLAQFQAHACPVVERSRRINKTVQAQLGHKHVDMPLEHNGRNIRTGCTSFAAGNSGFQALGYRPPLEEHPALEISITEG